MPDRLWLRSERQTLRRLPATGAVLFTIRVQQTPFASLAERPDVAAAFAARIRAQPDELVEMNGLIVYREAVLAWLDGAAAASQMRSDAGQRPAFGLVPWFAFLRRALILRLFVFFDMAGATVRVPAARPQAACEAAQATRSSAGQVLTTSVGLDAVAGGLVAAVGLPLELAGRVGVGVDADLAAPLEGEVEQLVGRVLALGPAVDLDRGVELGAGGEDDLGVEDRPACGRPARRRTATLRPVQWPRMSTWGLAMASTIRSVISWRSASAAWSGRWRRRRRAGRAGPRSWSSVPSSRMSTSMPVRMRNGASSLVERGDLVELGAQPLAAQAVGDR